MQKKDNSRAKKVYKIRRKSDGLFMTKGSRPWECSFSKKGSVWLNKGQAIRNIDYKHMEDGSSIPKDILSELEIVEFEEVKSYSIMFDLDKI